MVATQQSEELSAAEALRLLGGVPFGRVIFTSRALPAVRPVRHVVSDGQIVIAAGPELVPGPARAQSRPGSDVIVAYEADQLDSTGSTGWSVVVIGRARPVSDPAERARYRAMLPRLGGPDQIVAISVDVISGFRMPGPRDQRVTAGT